MPLMITWTIMKNLKILTLFGFVVFELDFLESEFEFESLSVN